LLNLLTVGSLPLVLTGAATNSAELAGATTITVGTDNGWQAVGDTTTIAADAITGAVPAPL
jgi:hypothetical protein